MARRSKRRRLSLSTSWGQVVESKAKPGDGLVRRWKAPRVQSIALPFAGERVKRPCPDSGFANAGPREALVAKATTR